MIEQVMQTEQIPKQCVLARASCGVYGVGRPLLRQSLDVIDISVSSAGSTLIFQEKRVTVFGLLFDAVFDIAPHQPRDRGPHCLSLYSRMSQNLLSPMALQF